MKPELKKLYDAALRVRLNAHVPYSGHKVGAAILTADGKIYTGCNVENSSYGGTICAERTAVTKAVSEQGKFQISEIMVVTDSSPPWPPCGMCRQVIAEFGIGSTIHSANLKGDVRTESFDTLFPRAFTPDHLKS